MVCAETKKQQQLKTLTQQLQNVEVKEGQSELSLTKSLVYMVGAMIRNFLKYSVTQITHCLNNIKNVLF